MQGTRHQPEGQKSWILALNPCSFQVRKTKNEMYKPAPCHLTSL